MVVRGAGELGGGGMGGGGRCKMVPVIMKTSKEAFS